MITFHMLTICGESIHKILEYIFRASLYDERFPSEWKNGNVVPIHKKDDYHILKTIGWYHYSKSAPKSLKE